MFSCLCTRLLAEATKEVHTISRIDRGVDIPHGIRIRINTCLVSDAVRFLSLFLSLVSDENRLQFSRATGAFWWRNEAWIKYPIRTFHTFHITCIVSSFCYEMMQKWGPSLSLFSSSSAIPECLGGALSFPTCVSIYHAVHEILEDGWYTVRNKAIDVHVMIFQ